MGGMHRGKKQNQSRKKVIILAIILAVVLTAVVLALILLDPGKKQEPASTSSSPTTSVTASAPSSEPIASSSQPLSTSAPLTSVPPSSPPAVTSKLSSSSKKMVTSKEPEANIDSIPYDPGDWALKLVNFEMPLEDEFDPGLSKIKSKYNPNGLKFDSRAVDALNIMCDAAKKDGVTLTVISAYRTISKQNSLYNNKVDRLVNAGYSREDALVEAATAVARPGTSEHHLGLAVDFNSVEQDFENTKAGKWLRQHASEYGFIMRYPSEKKDITGVIYEPWHFRFVGRKHAAAITQSGLCLEEYLESIGK